MQSSDLVDSLNGQPTNNGSMPANRISADAAQVDASNSVVSGARPGVEKKRLAVELANFEAMAKESRAKLVLSGSPEERASRVLDVAQQLFAAAPTWMAFYRELLGTTGVARMLYPNADEYRGFETTDAYYEIQKLITVLRAGNLPENDPLEAQRMITVRLPLSLHMALCQEAEERSVSVNQLCISRLLQMIGDEMIPNSNKGRRGRRPGPQGPRRDRNVKAEPSITIDVYQARPENQGGNSY
jgi:hypothetical protein